MLSRVDSTPSAVWGGFQSIRRSLSPRLWAGLFRLASAGIPRVVQSLALRRGFDELVLSQLDEGNAACDPAPFGHGQRQIVEAFALLRDEVILEHQLPSYFFGRLITLAFMHIGAKNRNAFLQFARRHKQSGKSRKPATEARVAQ